MRGETRLENLLLFTCEGVICVINVCLHAGEVGGGVLAQLVRLNYKFKIKQMTLMDGLVSNSLFKNDIFFAKFS